MVFPPKVERIKKGSPMCSSEFIPQTISEAETVTLDLMPGLYFLQECYLKASNQKLKNRHLNTQFHSTNLIYRGGIMTEDNMRR